MSIQLMSQALSVLNKQGFSCHIDSSGDGFQSVAVFKSGRLILIFNNHDATFEHRLSLLAETGLKGRWYGISC